MMLSAAHWERRKYAPVSGMISTDGVRQRLGAAAYVEQVPRVATAPTLGDRMFLAEHSVADGNGSFE